MSVNRVILIGRLGRDAELRTTSSEKSKLEMSLATEERWNDRNGDRQSKTEWHRVVKWGKGADALAPHLTKGKEIYVEGKLTTREYEKAGEKRYMTEVVADNIVLLGSRPRHDESGDSEDEGY